MATSGNRSQLDSILSFLEKGGRLTATEARKRFGVRRLAARIFDLRNEGFVIYTNRRTDNTTGRKVVHYRLDNSQQV